MRYLTSVLVITLLLSSNAFAEETSFAEAYSFALKVKQFSTINVSVQNSSKDILTKDQLLSFVKLRVKNNYSTIKYQPFDYDKLIKFGKKERAKHGFVYVSVKTVGDDYPVAISVFVRVGSYAKTDYYANHTAGFTSKEKLVAGVKRMINDLIEDSAIVFFTARGEM